jgi:hypothetical protein
MQTFRLRALIRYADEIIRTTLSILVIPAVHSIWLIRLLAPLGYVVLFAAGCSHMSSLQRPLAFPGNRSIAAFRRTTLEPKNATFWVQLES